ncbi:MAG: hypothetical protein A2X46_12190 [Lentisphaerae bacterium GWF2_57_35]|nr:MAG: hypothetical protein A2X46_12190 [Lentisphaerae bacterium GWF2_57_35]
MTLAASIAMLMGIAGCVTKNPQQIFRHEIRRHQDQAAFIPKIPCHPAAGKQNEWGALAGVLNYWGRRVSPVALETRFSSLPSGLHPYFTQAAGLAGEMKLWASAASLPLEALKIRVKAGVPIMTPLQDRLLDFDSRQYVIVAGFDDVSQKVFLIDGTPHGTIQDYGFFLKKWSVQRFAALQICPPSAPTWTLSGAERLSRAGYYYAQGDYASALQDYRQAVVMEYAPAEALIGEGNAYRSLGDYEKAEEAYRSAIAADPRNGSGYNNLAYLLAERSKNPSEAVALARQAVVLDPSSPFAFDSLGFVLYQQAQYKDAEQAFEKARSRARSHPLDVREAIAVHLVRNHLKSGQRHLACQVLADLMRENPQYQAPDEFRGLLSE